MRLYLKGGFFFFILLVVVLVVSEHKTDFLAFALDFTDSGYIVNKFVPQLPCAEVYKRPGLEGIIRKVTNGRFSKSLTHLEDNLTNEFVDTQDKMSEQMLDCYIVIGQNLGEAFKSTHPDSILTKLGKFKDTIYKNNNYASKVNEVEQELHQLKDSIEAFEKTKKETRYLEGYVVGEHESGLYEIRYNYGQIALLLTKSTNFSSKGLFALYVKDKGEVPVTKTKEAGGFEAKVRVFEEVDKFTEMYKLAEQNKQIIKDLEPKIKEQRVIFEKAQEDFRSQLSMIALEPSHERVPLYLEHN